MSRATKKVASIVFVSAMVLATFGATMPSAAAQSTADLQAQIAALLAQIQALQTQLNAAGGSVSAPASCSFSRDLTLNSTGADVKCLQQWLNANGYQVAASGAGSAGNETSFFGPATRAALAKYQAAKSISPAAGYFGPKTRASLSAGGSTGTGTGTGTTPPVVTVPAGVSLWVGLASDNPPAATIGSGTAFNPGLKLVLTAGASDVSIKSLKVQKTGFVANSNVTGVDVIDSLGLRHGNVITSVSADSDVLILLPNDPIVVKAGTSQTILVRFNISSAVTSGTIQLGIASAAAVDAGTGMTVSGSFPVWGNIFQIVSGSNAIASTTVSVRPVNASGVTLNVDPANSQEITKFRVTETSSKEGIWMKKLTLYNYGNAGASDFSDVQLIAQDGTLLATGQPLDKWVILDLSANPYFIDKGLNKDFTVRAKIKDGTTKTIQLVLYNDYDLIVVGKDSGASVLPSAADVDTSFPVGDATNYNKVTIGQGTLIFTRASDSPTAAVVPGATNVVLAKYDLKPTGEQMELRQVSFGVSHPTTSLTGTVYVRVNGSIVYSAAASDFATSGTAATKTLSTYPILTAGVNNTLTFEGSVSSNAVSSDVYSIQDVDILQVKRLVSNDLTDPSVATIDGNTINVQAADLDVTTLATPVANSVVGGTNNYHLATFQFSAATGGEDVKLKSVTVSDSLTGGNTAFGGVTNLLLYKEGETSALATTASTATNATTTLFTFLNPVVVTRTSPLKLTLKGDISSVTSSSIHTFYIATTSNVDAVGNVTGNTLSGSSLSIVGGGQAMTVVSGGTLIVSNYSGTGASPSNDQLVSVGTSNGVYLAFKMTAQFEAQKISTIILTASATNATSLSTNTLQNIRLYRDADIDPFATAGQFSCTSGVCTYTFSASDNLLPSAIQTTAPITIYVKADVSGAGSANLNDNFVMKIGATTDITAKGNSTGVAATITGTAVPLGKTYVTPFSVVVSGYSPTSNVQIGTGAGAELGKFKVMNNGAAAIVLGSTTISLSGSVTSSPAQQFYLYASADGGSANDTSVTYGTSVLTSGNLFGDLLTLVASATEANRTVQGNSWRYLTVKTVNVAANNDNAALSINSIGNVRYHVTEANLGYSGNPSSDNDVSDTISGLFADGKPSLATVTMKN